MNKLFKLPFYMAVSAMMAASFTACDDDNNGNPGDGELSAKDQALKEAITPYVDNTVIPTYKTMADEAIMLSTLCDEVRDLFISGNVTDANSKMEEACEHWTKSREAWELSEAFLFGAAGDYNIDPHIDSWPLDKPALIALLSNPSIVTPRPNLQPVPDVGQRNRTPAARPLATQGVAQDPASMKRMDEPSLPQSQNLALPEVAPESVQTAAQVEQQRARRARAAHIQARKAMMGHSGPSGQGRGQRAHGVRAQGVTPQRGNHQALHRAQVASAPLAQGAQYGGQMHGYNQPSQEVPLGANRPMSPMQPNQQAYQASQMSLPPNLEQSAPVQGRTAYSPAQSFQRQGQSRPYMQPDVGQSAVLNQGQQASRPQGQQGGNSAFAQSIAVPSHPIWAAPIADVMWS